MKRFQVMGFSRRTGLAMPHAEINFHNESRAEDFVNEMNQPLRLSGRPRRVFWMMRDLALVPEYAPVAFLDNGSV